MALSDHYLVYCIRKFNGEVTKDHKVIKTRKMNKFEEGQFLTDVTSVFWESVVTQTDDIDILVKNWSALFSMIIDKHAPIMQMRVSEKYCPWINQELKALMRNRDRMKMVALKRKSSIMMESYRQLRNKVNTLNIKLKKQYFSNKISACKGNVKDSWKTINELLNKSSKSCNIDFLKDSDRETRQRKDISNLMNEYFCSIGENLASKIEDAPNPFLAGDSVVNQKNTRFKFKHISTLDIRDAIAKLKTAKSFGNDTISSYFLKLALPVMETSLAIMFNTSIETSQFPNLWKLARITPIFKGGDRSDKSNYRPISILPVMSRLFEKLIADQLYQYMNENDMFSSNQSGFRRLHSTLTCLLKNTDDWYSGLDLGKLVGLVFIDLKKAFDTFNHDILCHKLSFYGIQQRELLWFQSYNVCQKYLERLYSFKNFLPPSCFRGINENVHPLPPLYNVGSVAKVLSYLEKYHLSQVC